MEGTKTMASMKVAPEVAEVARFIARATEAEKAYMLGFARGARAYERMPSETSEAAE